MSKHKKVVMSGMRPTGRLHLGNYWGALKNWISLQAQHECYFCIVDWHMLTTGYQDTASLQENIREMLLDWLAAGLDPEHCTIFLQSQVPQHAELTLLLSMVTPLSWLENNPTWKEQLQELAKSKLSHAVEQEAVQSGKASSQGARVKGIKSSASKEDLGEAEKQGAVELRTHGFLGYPVLQTADIVLYGAELVPVGQDQLPHVELAREIVRRFNALYGTVLVEPHHLVTTTPKVPGIDARKMSKSYGNSIDLLETPQDLKAKVMSMYTDPNKLRANDPGHPEPCPENPPGCVVYSLHKIYSGHFQQRELECRQGKIGCVACKEDLLKSLQEPFAQFRQKREELSADSRRLKAWIEEGSRKARHIAEGTMERVRQAMHLR